MKNLVTVIIFFAGILIPKLGYSQGTCPNLNFSYGDFTHWQCYAGSCSNGVNINPSPPVSGRHTIMDAAALVQANQLQDERCIVIPKVPAGFAFAARLGDDNAGAEMEAMEYTMTIDNSNSFLLLHFAWVMENSNHPVGEQPQFSITLKDTAGNTLGIPCAFINFVAGDPNMLGLVCNSSVQARTWTTVGYTLDSLAGQTIKICFETRDCAQGCHFGYAYVVGECRPMLTEIGSCEGQHTARMRAPEGFVWYKWTRSSDSNFVYEGSERSYMTYVCPDVQKNEVFTCEIRSELGCTSTLRIAVSTTDIDADFGYGVKNENGEVNFSDHGNKNWYDSCNRTVTFVDLSTVTNSTKASISWEIEGTNIISHDSLFTHTFPDPEVPTQYLVRFMMVAENGCVDTSAVLEDRYITIYPSPKININSTRTMNVTGADTLRAISLRCDFVSYQWSWQHRSGSSGTDTGYMLVLTEPWTSCILQAEDDKGCYASDTIWNSDTSSFVSEYLQGLCALGQNIPNPAGNSTLIPYSLPSDGSVTFNLYSITGQILYSQTVETTFGVQSIDMNISDLAAGLYFYSMEFKGQRLVKRMIIER